MDLWVQRKVRGQLADPRRVVSRVMVDPHANALRRAVALPRQASSARILHRHSRMTPSPWSPETVLDGSHSPVLADRRGWNLDEAKSSCYRRHHHHRLPVSLAAMAGGQSERVQRSSRLRRVRRAGSVRSALVCKCGSAGGRASGA